MKYIDADKLKAELKKLSESDNPIEYSSMEKSAYNCALYDVEYLITSLQQEQPQVADASKMEPEVDLEKEIDKAIADYSFTKTIDSGGFKTTVIDYVKIARHFYELGLNARKED